MDASRLAIGMCVCAVVCIESAATLSAPPTKAFTLASYNPAQSTHIPCSSNLGCGGSGAEDVEIRTGNVRGPRPEVLAPGSWEALPSGRFANRNRTKSCIIGSGSNGVMHISTNGAIMHGRAGEQTRDSILRCVEPVSRELLNVIVVRPRSSVTRSGRACP